MRRRKVRFIRDSLLAIPHCAPLLLLSEPNPLALGVGPRFAVAVLPGMRRGDQRAGAEAGPYDMPVKG